MGRGFGAVDDRFHAGLGAQLPQSLWIAIGGVVAAVVELAICRHVANTRIRKFLEQARQRSKKLHAGHGVGDRHARVLVAVDS